jgi:apolipoprotein N-acyltransferase
VIQPNLRHLMISTAATQPSAEPTPTERHNTVNALVLARLAADTRRAAAEGAQLVVWPEKALSYFDPRQQADQLRALVAQAHVYLVFGYSPDPGRYNQATLLAPDGQFLGVYNKQHPVFFSNDHSIGGPVRVLDTAIARIAPIICYDLDFENTAQSAARNNAQLLAVPSWDWPGIAEVHYTHLVFRAVENRLAAVKADTAWDSAIIDPEGRILASTASTKAHQETLIATVPLGSGHSLLTWTGNWVGWLTVLLALVSLVPTRMRRRFKP